MSVYYNDFEPFACEAIRRNIKRGRLGAGHVDRRSIVEVQPTDLNGFTICHFFAGIGGFELARLMAGWPDDLQLWTGGFPCQDISCAGKGEGIDGKRSGMWFEFLRLIRACRPARLLIENVPALRTRGADIVLDGLEREGYAARPIVVGAANVGAPHRRNRVWIWCELADGKQRGRKEVKRYIEAERGSQQGRNTVAQPMRGRLEGCAVSTGPGREGAGAPSAAGAGEGGLVHAAGPGLEGHGADAGQSQGCQPRRAGASDGGFDRLTEIWPARPGEPQHEWEEPRLVNAKLRRRSRPDGGREQQHQGGQASGDVHRQGSGPDHWAAGQPEPALGAATHGLSRGLVELVRRHSDFDDAQAQAWLIRNRVRIENRWRREALKAVGNAIVPQVAAAVLRAWLAVQETEEASR